MRGREPTIGNIKSTGALPELRFAFFEERGAAFGQLITDEGQGLGHGLHLERGFQGLRFHGQVTLGQGEGMGRHIAEFPRQFDGPFLSRTVGHQLVGKPDIDRALALQHLGTQ